MGRESYSPDELASIMADSCDDELPELEDRETCRCRNCNGTGFSVGWAMCMTCFGTGEEYVGRDDDDGRPADTGDLAIRVEAGDPRRSGSE